MTSVLSWRRELTTGGAVAVSVLVLGFAAELVLFGRTDSVARARAELAIQAHVDSVDASLTSVARRLAERLDVLAGITGDLEEALLFEVVRVEAQSVPDLSITIYDARGMPRAWSGSPAEYGSERVRAGPAGFAETDRAGLRLVHVEPIVDPGEEVSGGTARRLGSVVTERVLSPAALDLEPDGGFGLETGVGRATMHAVEAGARTNSVPGRITVTGFRRPAADRSGDRPRRDRQDPRPVACTRGRALPRGAGGHDLVGRRSRAGSAGPHPPCPDLRPARPRRVRRQGVALAREHTWPVRALLVVAGRLPVGPLAVADPVPGRPPIDGDAGGGSGGAARRHHQPQTMDDQGRPMPADSPARPGRCSGRSPPSRSSPCYWQAQQLVLRDTVAGSSVDLLHTALQPFDTARVSLLLALVLTSAATVWAVGLVFGAKPRSVAGETAAEGDLACGAVRDGARRAHARGALATAVAVTVDHRAGVTLRATVAQGGDLVPSRRPARACSGYVVRDLDAGAAAVCRARRADRRCQAALAGKQLRGAGGRTPGRPASTADPYTGAD